MSEYRSTNVQQMMYVMKRYEKGELSLDEFKQELFGDVHRRTAEIAQAVLEDPNVRVASPAPYKFTTVYGEEASDATPY